ncbi:MAG: hypothetical protein JO352_32370 [Chloroflexi bacterium]|nr:hypothetical protein [Chloroflexota bacterium]MBV9601547.1 hypothetical protein [Chloroflexota bacterium]
MTSPEQAHTWVKPQRRTFFVADLKCYMCGSVSGSIESEQSLTGARPSGSPVFFRQTGRDENEAVQIANWRRLRCDRCGGPLFLDETDVVTRRYEDYNWLEERPRRGRPPKRLIEERRRERELLESQAA